MKGLLFDVWRYRFFMISSIKSDLRSKFVGSSLGGLWMILNPLSQVLIFTFVLSAVLSAKLPGINNQYAYAIYLMAGTLGWSLFSEIVNRCLTLFIDNANILKKLVFPKITLPLIVTGSALVNNLFLFVAILLIFGVLGHLPSNALIWLPGLIALNVALALGLGLVLGVLNVFMRDIGQIVPVIMQFLYWFTPIVYMPSIIPEQYQSLLIYNPMIPIITGYQSILLYNREPEWAGISIIAVIAIMLMAFALLIFRKASSEMVDQL
ncbi:MAG: ABC transporter permease [Methylococcales bacterium]